MPQEFYVLRCYCCERFQVHIVKKSKKWDCKMCGSKQSFIKIFGQGDAKQCREHVQKLNIENGVEAERLNQEYHKKKDLICVEPKEERWHGLDEHADAESLDSSGENQNAAPKKVSKWDCFLDPDDG